MTWVVRDYILLTQSLEFLNLAQMPWNELRIDNKTLFVTTMVTL